MSLEIMAKLHTLLANKLIVYQNNEEIIKDLVIKEIHQVQQIPPWDHFVLSFEAVCYQVDFTNYIKTNPLSDNNLLTIKMGNMEIPVYIDSYSINTIDITTIDGFFSTEAAPGATICGHFDSRSFDGNRIVKKEPEVIEKNDDRIDDRWEILDL